MSSPRDPAPTSSSPGSSSSSTKSSSPPRSNSSFLDMPSAASPHSKSPSTQLHPLLTPMPSSVMLAAELDPYGYSDMAQRDRLVEAAQQTAMPEKCLTFCSQRANAPPLCKMFCLRKRQPLDTREEQLARLRPPKKALRLAPLAGDESAAPDSGRQSSSMLYPRLSPQAGPSSDPTSHSSSSKRSQSSSWSWSPFEALRRRVEPYSFIYVRGAPEGPVGRYMEELEYNDGHNDFGPASRGAVEAMKRKRVEPKMEYIDWGEEGSVLHLPFTSLFGPIINIPQTLNRIFTPSMNFLTLYRDSFSSGAQSRGLEKIHSEIMSGSAFELMGKIRGFWAQRVKEKEEQLERERSEQVGGKGQ
ncbi:hypothetical protein BD324DRAFT_647948 [Kockovaella imperatae]|uniref:Uncharacterized protein n=1 Tax=Kockovaella imperatae TaxID=4999 RepID=A0A1Y1USS1_9TREE|nr:hypothetical protein BD324DRAFT_647948 [Kockovaella imperatae]ORX41051.1 hypothetical protein BD324DRAFT_647948 [Kockovaella imperatae]